MASRSSRRRSRRPRGASALFLVGVVAAALPAGALRPKTVAPPLSWVLTEAETGMVLAENSAATARPAGTLGNLMLLLLCLEQARLGQLPLDVPVVVSPLAAGVGGANRVPLTADKPYLLEDLLKAIAVASADNASVAVAEAIAGSVPNALEFMNARARRMGSSATQYAEIGGVGDAGGGSTGAAPENVTSARDVARLAEALLDHERVLEWTSLPGFPFDQGAAVARNANQLMGPVAGVDGLQVSANPSAKGIPAGFQIAATGQRNGLRLIAVVLGAADSASRYSKAAELLEWGFANYERVPLVKKDARLATTVRVLGGTSETITPIAARSLSLLRRRGEQESLTVRFQIPAEVRAPLQKREEIGELVFETEAELIGVVPVLSPMEIGTAGGLSGLTR